MPIRFGFAAKDLPGGRALLTVLFGGVEQRGRERALDGSRKDGEKGAGRGVDLGADVIAFAAEDFRGDEVAAADALERIECVVVAGNGEAEVDEHGESVARTEVARLDVAVVDEPVAVQFREQVDECEGVGHPFPIRKPFGSRIEVCRHEVGVALP